MLKGNQRTCENSWTHVASIKIKTCDLNILKHFILLKLPTVTPICQESLYLNILMVQNCAAADSWHCHVLSPSPIAYLIFLGQHTSIFNWLTCTIISLLLQVSVPTHPVKSTKLWTTTVSHTFIYLCQPTILTFYFWSCVLHSVSFSHLQTHDNRLPVNSMMLHTLVQ